MHLVLIDLIPALLSWEGRRPGDEPAVAGNALAAVDHLYSHFRLAGIADAGPTGTELRTLLDAEDLGIYFESVRTSAEFGPTVSARVVRRVVAGLGAEPGKVVVVTARPRLAEALGRERIRSVLTSHEDFESVPEAVESLITDRANP